MFKQKHGIDIIAMLKEKGYSTYRIRSERILGESTMQKLRTGGLPSWGELDKLCRLLSVQPCDLIEYVKEPDKQMPS